jgi:hypothetical protein
VHMTGTVLSHTQRTCHSQGQVGIINEPGTDAWVLLHTAAPHNYGFLYTQCVSVCGARYKCVYVRVHVFVCVCVRIPRQPACRELDHNPSVWVRLNK